MHSEAQHTHPHSEQSHDTDHKHDHAEGEECGHTAKEAEEYDDAIVFTEEQAEMVGLTTEEVTPQPFSHVIKTSGQIQPAQGDEAVIVATSNGIVSFVSPSITEGTAVRAGQAIVSISAKKLLEGDPAKKAKIEYETSLKEYQRAESLIKDKIISAKDFEQAKLRYETAKTAYEAQASHVTSAGVCVSSPIAGFIKNKLVSQGEYVSVGQAIATVSQNKRLQLRAEVSEKHYKALKSIRGANFKPSYDDVVYNLSELNGKLLSHGKTPRDKSFFIPVTFEFDNIGDIIAGAYTEVFLLCGTQENVLSVPVSAVTEEQGIHFVYLKHDNEHYKKQEVTLGQSDGARVQVLSGLSEGDNVVTKGVYQIRLAAMASVIPEGHGHSH